MLLTAVAVLIVLSPIVIIHEFGHFIACRLTGIGVKEFSFGFGKILWHKKVGETDYQIRAIPLGGFVEPSGPMFHPKNAKEAPKPYEFAAKKWYAKLFMVVNGALFNYILAALIFSTLIYVKGMPETDPAKLPAAVGEVAAGYPAEKIGLMTEDKITQINGRAVNSWKDLTDALENRQGDVRLTVKRGEETLHLTASDADFLKEKPHTLGVGVFPTFYKVSILKAAGLGVYQCWYWTEFSLKSLWKSFVKKQAPELSGPVGIVNVIHKSVRSGILNFIFLIGMLSLAVGMFNLFPIPILDGSYALVFLLEGLTGKLPNEKVINVAMNIGLYILLLLFSYATYLDVKRIYFTPKNAVTAAQNPAPAKTDSNTEAN